MKEWFKENWVSILMGIIIIILSICLFKSCQNEKNQNQISEQNIIALTDSINYYKGENNKLVAEKTLLIGDKEILELAYNDLAKQLKEMKVKNADIATKLSIAINNIKHDTCWQVVENNLHEDWNFDDMPYRKLSGVVDLCNSKLSMSVDTDKVYLDLTVAVEDNKVKVSSNNPYLAFEEMYGITTPEYEPTWCLVVGPAINLGYGWGTNFNGGNCPGGLVASAGISLTFGWNIIGVGKRVKKK